MKPLFFARLFTAVSVVGCFLIACGLTSSGYENFEYSLIGYAGWIASAVVCSAWFYYLFQVEPTSRPQQNSLSFLRKAALVLIAFPAAWIISMVPMMIFGFTVFVPSGNVEIYFAAVSFQVGFVNGITGFKPWSKHSWLAK